ncbi:hypothetical protein AZI86_16170 [Bdellovibrio bacteriovorus]|uniref:Fatty acid hydroxylase domain-containing protein n=1 Tax=Bdellovibrio bacteriovorus TaxID=959 RepID=A0A150WGS4_BDEBC|nr:hypothetical protein AZI86_16170 [Bdellovibrio bacteriovorus]
MAAMVVTATMAVTAAEAEVTDATSVFLSFLDWIKSSALILPTRFLSESDSLSWRWFFSAFLIASLSTLLFSKNLKRSLRRLKAHLFSKRAKGELALDLKFFAFKFFYDPIEMIFYGIFFAHATVWVERSLRYLMYPLLPQPLIFFDPVFGPIAYIILLFLLNDFAFFIFHYLSHKYASLWDLHAVHHRARHLNPLTKYRVHPLSMVISFFVSIAVVGVTLGIVKSFVYFPRYSANDTTRMLQNIILFSFAWSHLRHSAYWISFGKFLSYILISPAMHQIHHSRKPEHLNKNFGSVFAVWDYIFGTLYIPVKKEKLWLGESALVQKEPWTFTKEMLEPLRSVKRRWMRKVPYPRLAFAVTILFLMASLLSMRYFDHNMGTESRVSTRVSNADTD